MNEYNAISLIGNIANIYDIKTLPSGKKYQFFDLCKSYKYKDNLGEEKTCKSFFTIRLFDEQISKYADIIKKGNLVKIFGKLKNYISKDMIKKEYITIDSLVEFNKKKDIEVFDYDWLNDPDF